MNDMIEKLKKMAAKKNGLKKVYKPENRSWDDCYVFDCGYHQLIYHINKNEKTSHMIAATENGELL